MPEFAFARVGAIRSGATLAVIALREELTARGASLGRAAFLLTLLYACGYGVGSLFLSGAEATVGALVAQLGLWLVITVVLAVFVDRWARR